MSEKKKRTKNFKIRQLLIRARQEVKSLSPCGVKYPLYHEHKPIATIDEALALTLPEGRNEKISNVVDCGRDAD